MTNFTLTAEEIRTIPGPLTEEAILAHLSTRDTVVDAPAVIPTSATPATPATIDIADVIDLCWRASSTAQRILSRR